jgi:hypothetical protein
MKHKRTLNDVLAYIIGKYRYKLFYNVKLQFLMRNHIFEQIQWRISVMNLDCYLEGSCIKCGCDTTALQMANKACGGKCYPKMMSKKEWKTFQINLKINDYDRLLAE